MQEAIPAVKFARSVPKFCICSSPISPYLRFSSYFIQITELKADTIYGDRFENSCKYGDDIVSYRSKNVKQGGRGDVAVATISFRETHRPSSPLATHRTRCTSAVWNDARKKSALKPHPSSSLSPLPALPRLSLENCNL